MAPLTISGKNTNSSSLTDFDSWLANQPQGEFRDALSKISTTLHSGQDIIVATEEEELTPTQIARILGVSRAHLYKILDSGALPYRVVGARDRRIAMKDVKKYSERTEELRRKNAWQAAHLDDLEAAAIDEM